MIDIGKISYIGSVQYYYLAPNGVKKLNILLVVLHFQEANTVVSFLTSFWFVKIQLKILFVRR